MSEYGTLTIRLEFVRRKEGISTWHKSCTLVNHRNVTEHDARQIAAEFKSSNPQFAENHLHICWQADPIFFA